MSSIADYIINQAVFETSRSGGKGGQHVNKIETKVVLVCDLTTVFTDDELLYRFEKANHRYINYPVIRVSSEKTRSQLKNKEDVLKKLRSFVKEVLIENKKRKSTKIPKGAKEKRLKDKKGKSEIKSTRKKIDPRDI